MVTVVYMKKNKHFVLYLAQLLQKWKKNALTSVVEKIETNILFSKQFFENRTVYKIKWKNSAERGRLKMAIGRMRILCWVPKATYTYVEYVVFVALPQQKCLHEIAFMLPYKYIACPVFDSHIQHWTYCVDTTYRVILKHVTHTAVYGRSKL
jgi:hypothetical protein